MTSLDRPAHAGGRAADSPPPDETRRHFEENARLKAIYYASHTRSSHRRRRLRSGDRRPGRRRPACAPPAFLATTATLSRTVRTKSLDGWRSSPVRAARARFVCALAVARGDRHRLRDDSDCRRRDCRAAEWERRLRLRPDLLLSTVRAHAGRRHRETRSWRLPIVGRRFECSPIAWLDSPALRSELRHTKRRTGCVLRFVTQNLAAGARPGSGVRLCRPVGVTALGGTCADRAWQGSG